METTGELFQAFLKAPSYHLAIEGLLIMWVLWLIFHKSYKPAPAKLTEKEKEELIAEWRPEPLVPDTPQDHYALNPRVVTGKLGKYVNVDGKNCLNMATHNYLGLIDTPQLEEAALQGLKKYGVGSCGPRGFYGTVDIHLDLEERLAKFMGVEEAVLYSYGFATISSAIPAYSKHGDVIFCDECVSFAIQKGLIASRSKIVFFKHNDMADLERVLLEQDDADKKNPKKAKVTRRFLVVEGLYINYGDICPLPQLIELKKRFKVRIFIDETCSFGVLGKTGKGVTDHFGIAVDEVDLISATLEYSMGSYGGFTCGTSFVVDHQRLSGLGYCFSASLPPLQASVAIASLETLQNNPMLAQQLQDNAEYIHEKLVRIPELVISGEPFSPIKHLVIAKCDDRKEATVLLEKLVNYTMDRGVALVVARYLDEEIHPPPASIRLTVNSSLTTKDMDNVVSVITEACKSLL